MTSFRVLPVALALLLCGACATSSPTTPPDYVGEAREDCSSQDIPRIDFDLRSATDQLSMGMPGHVLNAAVVGVHHFNGIALCQQTSPSDCRTVDGQLEIQKLSRRTATGRFRLANDPFGTWRSFVLTARRLGDAVCG